MGTIQITPQSAPSTPSWMGEVAAFAQALEHAGILKAIQEQVRFARARFGTYDLIDFVVVLIGYAVSSEPMRKIGLTHWRSLHRETDCPPMKRTQKVGMRGGAERERQWGSGPPRFFPSLCVSKH